MKRAAVIILALFVLSLWAAPAMAGKRNDKDLLRRALQKKEVIKKKKRPSSKLIVRDELRETFQEVMSCYLAEKKDDLLNHFSDHLTQGMLNHRGDRVFKNISKDKYARQISQEFKYQDFTKATYQECFDPDSPRMMFVMSYEDMTSGKVPVWGFSISYKDIAKQMKVGEYLVIANTLPESIDKVTLPLTMYMIFKYEDGKWKVSGMG